MSHKPRVYVKPQALAAFVLERTHATLPEVAAAHAVAEITARRHLDGLVTQRKLAVREGTKRQPRTYHVPGARLPDEGASRLVAGNGTALELANDMRAQRKRLRRELNTGRRKITTVLLDPPDCVQRMPVAALLALAPGIGLRIAERYLKRCRIGPMTLVGALTDRQLRVLARLLT